VVTSEVAGQAVARGRVRDNGLGRGGKGSERNVPFCDFLGIDLSGHLLHVQQRVFPNLPPPAGQWAKSECVCPGLPA